ncbi:MAG: hypothetical protein R3D03_01560 [Geminicoccaceae bacterium]
MNEFPHVKMVRSARGAAGFQRGYDVPRRDQSIDARMSLLERDTVRRVRDALEAAESGARVIELDETARTAGVPHGRAASRSAPSSSRWCSIMRGRRSWR